MIKTRIKTTLVLAAAAVMGHSAAFAQNSVKGSLLGISGNVTDFKTNTLRNSKAQGGFSVLYWKGITSHTDFSVRYNGLLSEYTKLENKGANGYVNEFEGSLHARLWGDQKFFNPFLSAGIGAGDYSNKWTPYAPLGGGIQLNIASESYVFLQANYRLSFQEARLDNNMFYSLGVTQALTRKKEKPLPIPVVVEEVKDRDNDGVPDVDDACPDVPGKASLKGCPDRDNDGIPDKDDKCPDVAGLAKYNGCPIPDTDKDGINDEEDKCPTVPGIARYNGCPIPDTDGDGVNDEVDKCPTLPGTAANNGCPEIKEEVKKKVAIAAQNIYFATGSAKLLAKSNKSLDEIARILQEDGDLKLDINGHTDNTGKADKNQLLSENRARAVYDYLAKKGVSESRLQSAGFGQDQPVADNKTATGRSKNRRVELKLHYD